MGFMLRSDTRARVLMVSFRRVVTDHCFLAAFAAVKDFVARHGPYHGITDFSQVDSVAITNEMLNNLGGMAPAFPAAMRRIVVAPTPAAYVCARIVQGLRSGSTAPIEIVATTDEACLMLGTRDSHLVEVQASQASSSPA